MLWESTGKDKALLDMIRQGNGAGAYAQEDPLSKQEYEAAVANVKKEMDNLLQANKRYMQVNVEKLLKMLEPFIDEEKISHG